MIDSCGIVHWFYAKLLSYKTSCRYTDSLLRVFMFLVSAPVSGAPVRLWRVGGDDGRGYWLHQDADASHSDGALRQLRNPVWVLQPRSRDEYVRVSVVKTSSSATTVLSSVTIHTYRGQFDWQNLFFMNMHEAWETNLIPMKSHVLK